jgi:hypothetical protein
MEVKEMRYFYDDNMADDTDRQNVEMVYSYSMMVNGQCVPGPIFIKVNKRDADEDL